VLGQRIFGFTELNATFTCKYVRANFLHDELLHFVFFPDAERVRLIVQRGHLDPHKGNPEAAGSFRELAGAVPTV
jgi:hypothetical protein